MTQPIQPQGALSADDGLKFLAEVANTYAASLDEVARKPFAGYANASIAAIERERNGLRDAIHELREAAPGENEQGKG